MSTREIKRGTALIADVVNFYGQELRSLDATAKVLDDLYQTIGKAVTAQGGDVVKWLGDGALACFWGVESEITAVKVAQTLQADFEAFGKRHGFEQSGLTISIATGEMIAGTFGIGDTTHYDVFGEPVTCTAMIMPEASGAVTLCEATYQAVSDQVTVEELAEHNYFGALFAVKDWK